MTIIYQIQYQFIHDPPDKWRLFQPRDLASIDQAREFKTKTEKAHPEIKYRIVKVTKEVVE